LIKLEQIQAGQDNILMIFGI